MDFEKPKLESEPIKEDREQERELVEEMPEAEKEEVSGIDYLQEAENKVEEFKKEYRELAEKTGLSEETFDEIETKLKEAANSFQESENQLQEAKNKEKSRFRKRIFQQATNILAAATIGLSGVSVAKDVIPYFKEPPAIERVEKRESKQERVERIKRLEETLPLLQDKMGEHLPSFMRSIASQLKYAPEIIKIKLVSSTLNKFNSDIKLRPEKPSPIKEISGFEKLNYMLVEKEPIDEAKSTEFSPELIKDVVERTFPDEWVEGDVKSFKYINKSVEQKDGWLIAQCRDAGIFAKSKIEFFKSARVVYPYHLLGNIMGHELAHANDWEFDNQLSIEERIHLLTEVVRRLESPGRYFSAYVKSIKEKDKQYEYYKKCVEYWAEICGAYFSDPDKEDLPEQDRQLIENYLAKVSPDFNAREAKKIRDKLIQDYFKLKGVELPPVKY